MKNNSSTTGDKIKDLEFQKQSLTAEIAEVMAEIERLERRLRVTQIELTQLQYRRKTLKDKKLLVGAEIVALKNTRGNFKMAQVK